MATAEVVASISAVTAIAGQIADIVRSVREAKALTPEAKKAITEAQELVISLQSRLLQLQADALNLQAENAELREQIRQSKARASDREQYERRQVGKAWVVAPKGEDGPHYCPTCFDNGKMSTLSSLGRRGPFGITDTCPACKATFVLT